MTTDTEAAELLPCDCVFSKRFGHSNPCPATHRPAVSAALQRRDDEIERLRKALRACLEQAVGCAQNHYPGEAEYCEGEHIWMARAALEQTGEGT
jgi:hypothetical protein